MVFPGRGSSESRVEEKEQGKGKSLVSPRRCEAFCLVCFSIFPNSALQWALVQVLFLLKSGLISRLDEMSFD